MKPQRQHEMFLDDDQIIYLLKCIGGSPDLDSDLFDKLYEYVEDVYSMDDL